MLEGYDAHWINTNADNRKAIYRNLNNGKYIFRLKASNNDNIWSEKRFCIRNNNIASVVEKLGGQLHWAFYYCLFLFC